MIIDTSSEWCLVGLTDGTAVIEEEVFLHRNELSHSLLVSIEKVLTKANVSKKELKAIAVGIGPGSYTGTRLGVAVAKSLAFALGVPLKSFCSLLAFVPKREGSFTCALPTRGEEYFVARGSVIGSKLQVDSVGFEKEAEVLTTFTPNLSLLCEFLLEKEGQNPAAVELIYLSDPSKRVISV